MNAVAPQAGRWYGIHRVNQAAGVRPHLGTHTWLAARCFVILVEMRSGEAFARW